MLIAASPLVREMGEVCFAVYTPEGDSVALSTGIIVHVHTMSEAIKYMVRNEYESNPGIRDRDIFVNNDPLAERTQRRHPDVRARFLGGRAGCLGGGCYP